MIISHNSSKRGFFVNPEESSLNREGTLQHHIIATYNTLLRAVSSINTPKVLWLH